MLEERPTPTLRLRTTSGRALVLDRVGCNDRFGPDRSKVHTSMRPLIDVSIETPRGSQHVTTIDAVGLVEAMVPGNQTSLATAGTADIDGYEAARLVRWIADPFAVELGVPRLLVAADPDVQREVTRALGPMRVEVTRVDDGARALKLAHDPTPELIIVHSAVRAGLEALRRFRNGGVDEETKLILLAADNAVSPYAHATLSWPSQAGELADLAVDALELV
jgi:CheY-like chemotaxis protein